MILTPWPATRPQIKPVMHGWFVAENAEMLGRYIGPDTRCVIEVGSWYGQSAKWICERAPAARVYCIDPWGIYPEVAENPEWAALQPGAFNGFLANLWEYRARIGILRMGSIAGLFACYEALRLNPDVIYLDGDHTTENVAAEVGLCRRFFPRAVLVGDDWGRESVQLGVVRALSALDFARCVANNGVCWVFKPQ